jgi:hypothetical protein
VQNLRGGQRRNRDATGTRACGVEARGSCKNERGTALQHGKLAVDIGEADGALVLLLGKRGMGGFAKELHGTRTEPPQGFIRYPA